MRQWFSSLSTAVVCGAIAVADAVKDSAADAVAALHRHGLRTVLLTGDNPAAAAAVAAAVGIDEVIAEVLPEGKVDVIEQLRDRGPGGRDGRRRHQRRTGAGVARIWAWRSDAAPMSRSVPPTSSWCATTSTSCRRPWTWPGATMRTIRMNMVWAFGYNVAAIPIAAAGLLNPLIAGAAMAFSSFFVVSNSLRLRNFGLRGELAEADHLSTPTSVT